MQQNKKYDITVIGNFNDSNVTINIQDDGSSKKSIWSKIIDFLKKFYFLDEFD